MKIRNFSRIGLIAFTGFLMVGSSYADAAPASRAKVKRAEAKSAGAVVDWSAHAAAELEAARNQTAPNTADVAGFSAAEAGVLPTPATIRAEVTGVDSVIERTALRFGFLFEPYQAHGTGRFGAGQSVEYSNLPTTVLGQVDLRWLPFEVSDVMGRPATVGGYGAFGYSRQKIPLVAPSGFRYDDVALNTLRYEAGLAAGCQLSKAWNVEVRVGAGRISNIQTSQYSDVVGSFERPYLVGAIDALYHVHPRFAFAASLARRTPLADGTGSIAFDPVTVSGGFLVQVR